MGLQTTVSVLLPFRNAAATLAAALDTIRVQSLQSFECLVIDNESTDNSARIAAALCRSDHRFRVLRQSGDLVEALNAGVEHARAPYIARMDADDLAHPRRLERQLAWLTADPSLTIVSSLVAGVPGQQLRDGMHRYLSWLNTLRSPDEIRNALFIESPLVHPSVMLSRDAVRSVGKYQHTSGPEDYDLWLRLLLGGHRAAKVPEPLLHWRDSPDRLTRVDPRYQRQRFFDTKLRYFPIVVPPGTQFQVWGAGPIGRRWARALRTRGYAIRRFIDVDPRKIGRTACGASIEPPEYLTPGEGFVLAAVGSPGARERIESYLRGRDLRPWRDYLAVA
jgi:glycosyltransferase involved in cell wall biosynthesis